MIYWSEALSTEVSAFNIDVMLLTPSYICTGMTAFSDKLSRPSLTVPSAADYAASSIQSLGWASRTAGYWPHGLLLFFVGEQQKFMS